jgi:hypothetical protein
VRTQVVASPMRELGAVAGTGRDRYMKSNFLVAVLCYSLLSAALAGAVPGSGPAAPQVGVVQCADHSLRVLYGLPLNLFYGPVVGASAGRAAFANDIGLLADTRGITLISTHGALVGSLQTNAFDAVLGVAPAPAPGATASLEGRVAAWLPALSSIAAWTGAGFTLVPVDSFPGVVRAVTPLSNGTVALMISLPGGGVVRDVVSLQNGQVLSSTLAGSAALSMYERGGFTLSLDSRELTVSDAAGHIQMFPMAEPDLAIDSVADGAVVLRSPHPGRSWMLQLDDAALARGALRLSVLPGLAAARPARILPGAGIAPGPRGAR